MSKIEENLEHSKIYNSETQREEYSRPYLYRYADYLFRQSISNGIDLQITEEQIIEGYTETVIQKTILRSLALPLILPSKSIKPQNPETVKENEVKVENLMQDNLNTLFELREKEFIETNIRNNFQESLSETELVELQHISYWRLMELLFPNIGEMTQSYFKERLVNEHHLDIVLVEEITNIISDLKPELIEFIYNNVILLGVKYGHEPKDFKLQVITYKKLLQENYNDNREFLNLSGRNFHLGHLNKIINRLVDNKAPLEEWHRVAKVSFDINGMKGVNETKGHSGGNTFLGKFGDILSNGKTVTVLRKLGFIIEPVTESAGDEFGLIITGDVDLRLLLPVVKKLLLREMWETDVSNDIDLEHVFCAQVIESMEIEYKELVESDFTYRLSASIGSKTFGEVLSKINLKNNESYSDALEELRSNIVAMPDFAAEKNKRDFKRLLETVVKPYGNVLVALYQRGSADFLNIQNLKLEKNLNEEIQKVILLRAAIENRKKEIKNLQSELEERKELQMLVDELEFLLLKASSQLPLLFFDRTFSQKQASIGI